MAMPVVIAKNQTGSDIDLTRLGVRVPALGDLTLSGTADAPATYIECTQDESLEVAVSSGDIIINDGVNDLSTAEALVYLNASGNLDGPATGAAANVVLKLADASGTKTISTGVTIDGSNNISTPGALSASVLQIAGSPLAHTDLSASSRVWTTSGHTGTAGRIPSFDGSGVAAEVQIGVDLQAYDADLAALAGLVSTGIIVRNGAGAAVTRSIVQPVAGITVSNGDGVSGNPTLALANDLAALESLGATGFAARTGSDAWAQRSLTAPAAGFTISNPAGIAGNPTFALSDDLLALENLGSTGLAVRTGANTWAQRSLTAPAAGFTITNPAGIAGNPTFTLSGDLAGLEGMTGTGIVTRTAANTYAQRTLTGTAGTITVANGNGVSGNPTINVGANVIQTTTSLGGDLSGTLPNPTVTDFTITGEQQGSVLYYSGTNWAQLPPGTLGQVLTTQGVGANPQWARAAPISQITEANSTITTTSSSYVIATGMTLTPAAGTYLVFFGGTVGVSSNNARVFTAIHIAGVLQSGSEREFRRGGGQTSNTQTPFLCLAKVTVNGSQQIEGRWYRSSGTAFMYAGRQLAIVEVV